MPSRLHPAPLCGLVIASLIAGSGCTELEWHLDAGPLDAGSDASRPDRRDAGLDGGEKDAGPALAFPIARICRNDVYIEHSDVDVHMWLEEWFAADGRTLGDDSTEGSFGLVPEVRYFREIVTSWHSPSLLPMRSEVTDLDTAEVSVLTWERDALGRPTTHRMDGSAPRVETYGYDEAGLRWRELTAGGSTDRTELEHHPHERTLHVVELPHGGAARESTFRYADGALRERSGALGCVRWAMNIDGTLAREEPYDCDTGEPDGPAIRFEVDTLARTARRVRESDPEVVIREVTWDDERIEIVHRDRAEPRREEVRCGPPRPRTSPPDPGLDWEWLRLAGLPLPAHDGTPEVP